MTSFTPCQLLISSRQAQAGLHCDLTGEQKNDAFRALQDAPVVKQAIKPTRVETVVSAGVSVVFVVVCSVDDQPRALQPCHGFWGCAHMRPAVNLRDIRASQCGVGEHKVHPGRPLKGQQHQHGPRPFGCLRTSDIILHTILKKRKPLSFHRREAAGLPLQQHQHGSSIPF